MLLPNDEEYLGCLGPGSTSTFIAAWQHAARSGEAATARDFLGCERPMGRVKNQTGALGDKIEG